jgi:predicted nucleotidyltransferase
MSKILKRLIKEKVITPPKWLPDNTLFLGMTGSVSYGVSTDMSDRDIVGVCIPPKNMLFKPLNQFIPGFDKHDVFEQWQQHHIKSTDGNEYDFTVYNITKFFRLCMDNNPNMIDSLYIPRNCVLHSTPIYEKIRENRDIFLHKGCYHKFRGYAYSQIHKMSIKEPDPESKRYESVLKFGFDVKFAYHVVRVLDECEQILTTGTLDLQKNREVLKSIRRGEWSQEKIQRYFDENERRLKDIAEKSELPWGPDKDKIRNLLFECLEMHYDLSETIVTDVSSENKLEEIRKILDR